MGHIRGPLSVRTVVERLAALLSLPVFIIRYFASYAQTTLISRKTNRCGGYLACVHQRDQKVNADKNQIFYLFINFKYEIASMFASTFKNIKTNFL